MKFCKSSTPVEQSKRYSAILRHPISVRGYEGAQVGDILEGMEEQEFVLAFLDRFDPQSGYGTIEPIDPVNCPEVVKNRMAYARDRANQHVENSVAAIEQIREGRKIKIELIRPVVVAGCPGVRVGDVFMCPIEQARILIHQEVPAAKTVDGKELPKEVLIEDAPSGSFMFTKDQPPPLPVQRSRLDFLSS